MRLAALIVGVVAAGGCSFDAAGLGAGSGSTDAASTIDANPHVSDAPPGTPDGAPDGSTVCTPSCSGSTLNTCDPNTPQQACPLGCSTKNGAHCLQLVPSNGATDADDLTGVTAGLTVAGASLVFADTDTGAIWESPDGQNWTPVRGMGQGVVDGISFRQVGSISYFGVDSLTVAAGGYFRPYQTHAVVFLSRNDVVINGSVDLSGGCTLNGGTFVRTCAGAGGGDGGAALLGGNGCAGGGAGLNPITGPASGGGGGGFGQDGGKGGDGDGGHKGGAGGKASGCTGASLVPLQGGGGGGGGGGGEGGGGGGAIQITSFTSITVAPGASGTAGIDVGGRGGNGNASNGGGGGGAGGAILLESPQITVGGANLTANGGGGGAGRNGSNTGIGTKGSSTSATPAAGGVGDSNGGGGGAGGAGATGATAGNGPIDGGGGGGGAVGRIRLNVPAAAMTINASVVSPQQTRGDLTLQ